MLYKKDKSGRHKPQRLKEVAFSFGDNDFVDTDFDLDKKLISTVLQEKGYKCKVIKDWEHNLYLFDPETLSNFLLEFINSKESTDKE